MWLSEAASVLEARVDGTDLEFLGVSTDTRTLKAGDLFVALRGERYDGHRFVSDARAAGASAAMVDGTAPRYRTTMPLLVVPDTRLALGSLAAHWRSRFALPLVALTGSSGKTTVKEMLAAILREALRKEVSREPAENSVLATRGNLNNDIGMPLMLLELTSEHRYAVLEMGMNHEGEIRYLTEIAAPDIALVNNAGRAHIEFLGSEEAVARAKGEIFEGLRADGIAVINADDRHAQTWRDLLADRRRIEFGLDHPAAVTATYRSRALESEIVLKTPGGVAAATLRAPGVHNVRNALAAAAAAVALDVPVNLIAAGLQRFSGIKGRLQMKRGLHGAALIDDTYNANPESTHAAIEVLAATAGRKLLVFGDMGELGVSAPQLHAELGRFAKQSGVDQLFTLGEHSAETTKAFGAGARHFTRIEDLLAEVENALVPDITVLVKGSRFMKMERVVNAFLEDEGRRGQAGSTRNDVRAVTRHASPVTRPRGLHMLLELAQWLSKDIRAFNVFNYITLRAVLACLTALVLSFIVGPAMIRKLAAYKIGQAVRSDGPQTHLTKAGTPTMGGALILVSVVVTTLLWGDLSNRFVWVVLCVTLAFGAIGWIDDYRKVVHRNPKGLPARWKFFWQSVFGLAAAFFIAFSTNLPAQTAFIVPFFKQVAYPLGVGGFIVMTYFVIVGTSNAVNLTDGLDGLAIMPTVMIGSALGVFAYVAGHAVFSKYLGFPYIPGAGELVVICGALAGAGLAFLWFNAYPAEVFMGDVGALALGAALGTMAVIVRQEIVLFIMGGVFVVETLSVMLQVASFKLTGKRIFRMAPLHHHYELKGWKENQVVVRFWIITMMLVLIGLSTLKLR